MKDATTGKTSNHKSGTDWEALRRMKDVEIRAGIEADPDANATDDGFWKEAKVVWPQPKQVVTMRLDAAVGVVSAAKRLPDPDQRINAILRSYMKAHEGGGRGNPAP